jgi:hypothetical protein
MGEERLPGANGEFVFGRGLLPAVADPIEDRLVDFLLGINSVAGTSIWLAMMFVMIDNSHYAEPIWWMYERLSSSKTGWSAASYLAFFWAYGVVSVMELILWFVSKTAHYDLAIIWFSTVGYWGSMLLYALPPLFATLHLVLSTADGGIDGSSSANLY